MITKSQGLFFVICSITPKVNRKVQACHKIALNVRLHLLIHVLSMNSILINRDPCININLKDDNTLSMKEIISLILNLIDKVTKQEDKIFE